jgi:hypothetical protein
MFDILYAEKTVRITKKLVEDNLETLRSKGFSEKGLEYVLKFADHLDAEYLKEAEVEAREERKREEREKRSSGSFEDRFSGMLPGAVYHIDGARGRSIEIFPYKCVISVGTTLGSVITRNATDGEKTIYYGDCIGFQHKYPGITIGYLQFETASSTGNNLTNNFFNENTFTYEKHNISNEEIDIIVNYIKERFDVIKLRQYGNGS